MLPKLMPEFREFARACLSRKKHWHTFLLNQKNSALFNQLLEDMHDLANSAERLSRYTKHMQSYFSLDNELEQRLKIERKIQVETLHASIIKQGFNKLFQNLVDNQAWDEDKQLAYKVICYLSYSNNLNKANFQSYMNKKDKRRVLFRTNFRKQFKLPEASWVHVRLCLTLQDYDLIPEEIPNTIKQKVYWEESKSNNNCATGQIGDNRVATDQIEDDRFARIRDGDISEYRVANDRDEEIQNKDVVASFCDNQNLPGVFVQQGFNFYQNKKDNVINQNDEEIEDFKAKFAVNADKTIKDFVIQL